MVDAECATFIFIDSIGTIRATFGALGGNDFLIGIGIDDIDYRHILFWNHMIFISQAKTYYLVGK